MGTEFNDEGKRLYKELKKLQRTVIQNEGGLSVRQLKIFEAVSYTHLTLPTNREV